ncbi:hypothetical protein GQ457_12G016380 [Hibiscus cannabinus]
MRLFIQYTDYILWDVVLNGPSTPTKRERDLLIPKQRREWTEEDRRKLQLNAKVILFCALEPDDKLEVTHEGKNKAKKTKIDLLEPDENIKKKFDGFFVIVNWLKDYDKEMDERI